MSIATSLRTGNKEKHLSLANCLCIIRQFIIRLRTVLFNEGQVFGEVGISSTIHTVAYINIPMLWWSRFAWKVLRYTYTRQNSSQAWHSRMGAFSGGWCGGGRRRKRHLVDTDRQRVMRRSRAAGRLIAYLGDVTRGPQCVRWRHTRSVSAMPIDRSVKYGCWLHKRPSRCSLAATFLR